MAFVTKEWKDRLVEFAGRRKLKNVTTGVETVFDVSRSEGAVSQAGDAFSAANMNNLEQRIKNEFDTVNGRLSIEISSRQNSDVGLQNQINSKANFNDSDLSQGYFDIRGTSGSHDFIFRIWTTKKQLEVYYKISASGSYTQIWIGTLN